VRLHLPDSVPSSTSTTTAAATSSSAAAATTSGYQRIAHHTGGVGLEEVTGAAVLEGVENPHETVVGA